MSSYRVSGSARRRQNGISLIIVLLLLIASVFLGSSAAVIALQAEKASRGDRDRQAAFQAAEAAIVDAQRDIDTAPSTGGSSRRDQAFLPGSALGFPAIDQAERCFSKRTPRAQGLCRQASRGTVATWLEVDIADALANAVSVPYGQFTGQDFQTGKLTLPAKLPRYIIELMSYNQPGAETSTQQQASYFYRITAIGFGADVNTQVVLQAFYRREN